LQNKLEIIKRAKSSARLKRKGVIIYALTVQ